MGNEYMGITINGWGKNKKPNTIYLRGYKCYGHDKDDKKMAHNMFKCKWPNQIKWFCVYLMF